MPQLDSIDRLLERRGVALGLLTAVLVAVHLGYLTAPTPLWDEKMYLDAAALHVGGSSAYEHRYFNYPPPLVQLIATAQRGDWEWPLVLGWRSANLAAVIALAWWAARRTAWNAAAKWLAALAIGLSPVIGQALRFGNLSPLVSFAALAGFAAETRRPFGSALCLGAGIALKPVALAGGAFLSAHRALTGPRRPLPVAAGIWPLVTLAAIAPGAALLPAMARRMSRSYFDPHHLSLKRFLAGLGFEVSSVWIAAAVLVVALFVFRRRPLVAAEMVDVAPVVALLALPVVWAHSFALVLPLQLRAVERLVARVGGRASGASRARRLLEILAVLLPVAAIQGSASAALVNHWPPGVQIVVCLLPTLAPAALLLYVRTTRHDSAGPTARDGHPV